MDMNVINWKKALYWNALGDVEYSVTDSKGEFQPLGERSLDAAIKSQSEIEAEVPTDSDIKAEDLDVDTLKLLDAGLLLSNDRMDSTFEFIYGQFLQDELISRETAYQGFQEIVVEADLPRVLHNEVREVLAGMAKK